MAEYTSFSIQLIRIGEFLQAYQETVSHFAIFHHTGWNQNYIFVGFKLFVEQLDSDVYILTGLWVLRMPTVDNQQ